MHFYPSFLLLLSSAHRRRTISGLITANRLCTDESLLAMQNIWFNISIFHHALTAERVNSTLQFPWTPLLSFFVYANICILSHSVQSNISLVLCLFPLLISFPLFIYLFFFHIKVNQKHKVWNLINVFWNMNGCNCKALYMYLYMCWASAGCCNSWKTCFLPLTQTHLSRAGGVTLSNSCSCFLAKMSANHSTILF